MAKEVKKDKGTAKASPAEVQAHINRLKAILAKGAVGDFWDEVKIPDKVDEFTELYVGIELMYEVIREKYAELEGLNYVPAEKRSLWQDTPAKPVRRKTG